MWTPKEESSAGYADWYLAIYGGIKQFVIVLAVGVALKLAVFDSLKINGSQMDPAIRQGDRILIFKTPYIVPFLKNMSNGGRGNPVVISLADRNTNTVMRVAAVSGDTVSIDSGKFYLNGAAVENFAKDTEIHGVIPAEYSQSDFMGKIRIPAPNDSIDFQALNMHDFIFAYSVFRQEVPGARLKAQIMAGGALNGDFMIKDFALYRGRLDSIPEDLHTDWFFWERLQSYLSMTAEQQDGGSPQLAFSVLRNGKEVGGFRVKNRYLFVLGDNWNGAKDSRHLGPLPRANIKGRPFMTLWGANIDEKGKKHLNWGRIVRFVR